MRRSKFAGLAMLLTASALAVLGGCASEPAANAPTPSAEEAADSTAESATSAASGEMANASTPDAGPRGASDADKAAATPAAASDVALEVVDKEGFEQALEKHRGKIVLVDVWATWCAPCKTLFPHTVELHNKYADKGLAVISLSMDDEDAHQEALKFLQQQKATFTNLRSKQGAEEEAIEAFDIDGGALPHFKLYDREGKPVKKLTSGEGAVPPEAADVDKAVEQLLGE